VATSVYCSHFARAAEAADRQDVRKELKGAQMFAEREESSDPKSATLNSMRFLTIFAVVLLSLWPLAGGETATQAGKYQPLMFIISSAKAGYAFFDLVCLYVQRKTR